MDTETKLIIEWIMKSLPILRNSGDNWQLILHGAADGRVGREVKTTGELLPSKRKHPVSITKRELT